jgi:hypothetical protein
VSGITGVHPYADEFPMASEDELVYLTESISTSGLENPVVVARSVGGIADGRLVDGRNRREACLRAGVELVVKFKDFDSDDALKEWVIGVNTTGRRDSMTVQIAAASKALVLGKDRRKNGRWIGWKNATFQDLGKSSAEREADRQCGLILDILGRDALREVRDCVASLNSVHERAVAAREGERLERERLAKEASEEKDAKAFIEAHDPELAAEVGGPSFRTHVEAKAVWEKRNRDQAAAIRQEEAMRVAARAAELSAWGKACDGLLAALSYAAASRPPEDTDRYTAVGTFIERYEALGTHITTWKENQ